MAHPPSPVGTLLVLLAATATSSIAAPPQAVLAQQNTTLTIVIGVLLAASGALGWLFWNARRSLATAHRLPPLPPADALSAAIVKHTSDAIFTIDAAGLVHSINPAAVDQFGYHLDEIRGKNISALIPPPARGRQRSNYMANPSNRELFGVRRDGTRFPVDVKLDELTFANWELLGLTVRDVTARHVAERDLEHRLATADAILNQTGALVFVLNPEGQIQRINRATEALLDFSSGEVRGQSVWEIAALPERMEALETQIREYLRGPFPAKADLLFSARDGHNYTLSCIFTATLDELSTIEHIILTAHDISARRMFESSQLRTERMAAVSRLAGGVAHDFNNLLTAITGYSGLVLQGLDDANPLRKDVEQIKRAGDRGAALTRQLLALSGRHPRQPRLVNLNESLESARRMLGVLTGEPVQLEILKDPKLPPVQADMAQVEEVILHLAAFLREQMPQGGRLTLRTTSESVSKTNPDAEPPLPPGSYALLTLTDSSRGLSPDAISHLFEPFYPSQETTRSNNLGLAMVAGLIKQNGGAILVTSAPGAGNTIRVYLPQAAQPEFLTPERPKQLFMVPKKADLSGSETVLLALEKDAERAVLRQTLEGAGYTVLEARSGLQAMEIAHKHPGVLHLLVTDVQFPRMSGADLAMGVRVGRPAIRTLFASSQPNLDAGIFALQSNFEDGPFLTRVREVLDAKSMSVGQ